MDVILDDGPFLDERLDRPRSHTWPLPDPAGLLVVDTKNVADQSPEPCQPHITVSSENHEGVKKYVEGTSPRKNNRKNAWGNLSYADLITQAIDNSPDKRLTLAQIYEWMVKNIVYFKDKGDSTSSAGWKNSIRHNLSLHNRFMRVQNDQSGKSSYWVLNPDASSGKSPRRRSGSVDGAGKAERKRGGGRKKNSAGSPEEFGNNLSPLGSASSSSSRNSKKKSQSSDSALATSPCSSTDSLSNLPDLDETGGNFILSAESFTRPRSTSNVSTHSSVGRLTPIPGEELEDEFASYNETDLIVGGRPRGTSDAEATASLVESLTLGRKTDTINLDESLKFETNMMNGNCGYSTEPARPHSDSFSSVQSGDSGYESPASYFVTPAVQSKPTMQQMHTMMPLQKAPPPYQNAPTNQPKFTPVRQQQNPPKILARSQFSSCAPTGMPDRHSQGFFSQSSQPQMQINQRGYISAQPMMRRLQHMPLPVNSIFSGSTTHNANLTTMSDPYLPSVSLAGKEERNFKVLKNIDPNHGQIYSVPMEQDTETFPSDLSHLELHDFSDRFQLQRDLESIIRNEMGDGNLEFEQSYVTASSVNTMSITGQNWVH